MKRLLIILFIIVSISSFAETSMPMDTISNWQVYNGGKLLNAFNASSEEIRIVLTKGKIRAVDTVNVKYFDDTPCVGCKARLTIKTKENKTIRTIDNSKSNYNFDIKTTDLQVLALKNKSTVLRFYYKEDESDDEILLFEIEIR